MRRWIIAAAAVAMASPAWAADVKIGITAIVEHPALDAVRTGIVEGLEAAGYEAGVHIDVAQETAQGNPAIAAQIARKFVGDGDDIIVPISTPSAQAAVAATSDIPIVFTAVTDPIAAKIVTDLEKPGGNVTGLSDMSPMAEHVALIKEITPDVTTVGVIYNPGEVNSVSLVNRLKEVAGPAGLDVVEAPATKSADVQAAARSLIGKADVIYIPTDNTVVSALEAVVAVAEENDIPLYAGDTESVGRGALASIGFDYHDVGLQTAAVIVRILEGENPGDIPVAFATGTDLHVNEAAAEKMGVTIPAAVTDRATMIVR